MEKMVWF